MKYSATHFVCSFTAPTFLKESIWCTWVNLSTPGIITAFHASKYLFAFYFIFLHNTFCKYLLILMKIFLGIKHRFLDFYIYQGLSLIPIRPVHTNSGLYCIMQLHVGVFHIYSGFDNSPLNRGYYMPTHGCGFYLWVSNSISHEWAKQMCKILSWTRVYYINTCLVKYQLRPFHFNNFNGLKVEYVITKRGRSALLS